MIHREPLPGIQPKPQPAIQQGSSRIQPKTSLELDTQLRINPTQILFRAISGPNQGLNL